MELLLSNNKLIKKSISYRSVSDYFNKLAENSDQFNIATGFVSNASLVELNELVAYRQRQARRLSLNLLVGMDYIGHFTKLQYEALRELDKRLTKDRLGSVMISRYIQYHGKMYSFLKDGKCNDAFIGSSNLGSFIGTSDELLESDILLHGEDAEALNNRICQLYSAIGTKLADVPKITEFRQPHFTQFNGNRFVKRVHKEYVEQLSGKCISEDMVEIPLKTEPKSNLNAHFGAGKRKGVWSPRDWYEVEVIVSEKDSFRQYLSSRHFPVKDQRFTVVTTDGYQFDCMLEGGNKGKNLRTVGDLRIFGKWIKGHMEEKGVLKLGEIVTPQTLQAFGCDKLVFTRTTSGVWLLKMA